MTPDPAVLLRAVVAGTPLERTLGGPSDTVVIGRGSASSWRLDEPLLSRRHVRIEWKAGVLEATDLESRNGSRVNGAPLRAPTRLAHGDRLTAGPVVIEVSILAAQEDLTVGRPLEGRTLATRVAPAPARRRTVHGVAAVLSAGIAIAVAVWRPTDRADRPQAARREPAPRRPSALATPRGSREAAPAPPVGELRRDAIRAYAEGRRDDALRLFERIRARGSDDPAIEVLVRVLAR